MHVHTERVPTPPLELTAYVQRILDMYQACREFPLPSNNSSDDSSMSPLMDPRSSTSSDSSTDSDSRGDEPDIFDSPNGPGTDGRPFGHTTPAALTSLLLAELLLNDEPTIDIFS